MTLKLAKFLQDLAPGQSHRYLILEGLKEYIFGKKHKDPKKAVEYKYMSDD